MDPETQEAMGRIHEMLHHGSKELADAGTRIAGIVSLLAWELAASIPDADDGEVMIDDIRRDLKAFADIVLGDMESQPVTKRDK